MKFNFGQLVATVGVNEALYGNPKFQKFVKESFQRHINGDWGDLDKEDKNSNDLALESGEDRIFSAYKYENGVKIWIITEWDRSVTTILFPEEY